MQPEMQQNEFVKSLNVLGWRVDSVKPNNGIHVAKATGPVGQVVERTGHTEDSAVYNLLLFAQRSGSVSPAQNIFMGLIGQGTGRTDALFNTINELRRQGLDEDQALDAALAVARQYEDLSDAVQTQYPSEKPPMAAPPSQWRPTVPNDGKAHEQIGYMAMPPNLQDQIGNMPRRQGNAVLTEPQFEVGQHVRTSYFPDAEIVGGPAETPLGFVYRLKSGDHEFDVFEKDLHSVEMATPDFVFAYANGQLRLTSYSAKPNWDELLPDSSGEYAIGEIWDGPMRHIQHRQSSNVQAEATEAIHKALAEQ